eukprot:943856-Prorocentrum_minimum.AAC.1
MARRRGAAEAGASSPPAPCAARRTPIGPGRYRPRVIGSRQVAGRSAPPADWWLRVPCGHWPPPAERRHSPTPPAPAPLAPGGGTQRAIRVAQGAMQGAQGATPAPQGSPWAVRLTKGTKKVTQGAERATPGARRVQNSAVRVTQRSARVTQGVI